MSFNQEFGLNLFRCFRLPYESLMEMVEFFATEMRIQPSEFFNLFFYEILMLMDIHVERMKKQNKSSEEQQVKAEKDMSRMQQNFNMNNFRPPEIKMPEMPKTSFNL